MLNDFRERRAEFSLEPGPNGIQGRGLALELTNDPIDHIGRRVWLLAGELGRGQKQVIRRAASERGSGQTNVRATVAAGAERADVALRDDALVLGGAAAIGSRPVLEVAADRVSALVTTAVGSIDEEAIFYVQTRGIARAIAERMMALAFFEPAIAGFPSDALRDEVRTALDAALDRIPETFAT